VPNSSDGLCQEFRPSCREADPGIYKPGIPKSKLGEVHFVAPLTPKHFSSGYGSKDFRSSQRLSTRRAKEKIIPTVPKLVVFDLRTLRKLESGKPVSQQMTPAQRKLCESESKSLYPLGEYKSLPTKEHLRHLCLVHWGSEKMDYLRFLVTIAHPMTDLAHIRNQFNVLKRISSLSNRATIRTAINGQGLVWGIGGYLMKGPILNPRQSIAAATKRGYACYEATLRRGPRDEEVDHVILSQAVSPFLIRSGAEQQASKVQNRRFKERRAKEAGCRVPRPSASCASVDESTEVSARYRRRPPSDSRVQAAPVKLGGRVDTRKYVWGAPESRHTPFSSGSVAIIGVLGFPTFMQIANNNPPSRSQIITKLLRAGIEPNPGPPRPRRGRAPLPPPAPADVGPVAAPAPAGAGLAAAPAGIDRRLEDRQRAEEHGKRQHIESLKQIADILPQNFPSREVHLRSTWCSYTDDPGDVVMNSALRPYLGPRAGYFSTQGPDFRCPRHPLDEFAVTEEFECRTATRVKLFYFLFIFLLIYYASSISSPEALLTVSMFSLMLRLASGPFDVMALAFGVSHSTMAFVLLSPLPSYYSYIQMFLSSDCFLSAFLFLGQSQGAQAARSATANLSGRKACVTGPFDLRATYYAYHMSHLPSVPFWRRVMSYLGMATELDTRAYIDFEHSFESCQLGLIPDMRTTSFQRGVYKWEVFVNSVTCPADHTNPEDVMVGDDLLALRANDPTHLNNVAFSSLDQREPMKQSTKLTSSATPVHVLVYRCYCRDGYQPLCDVVYENTFEYNTFLAAYSGVEPESYQGSLSLMRQRYDLVRHVNKHVLDMSCGLDAHWAYNAIVCPKLAARPRLNQMPVTKPTQSLGGNMA